MSNAKKFDVTDIGARAKHIELFLPPEEPEAHIAADEPKLAPSKPRLVIRKDDDGRYWLRRTGAKPIGPFKTYTDAEKEHDKITRPEKFQK